MDEQAYVQYLALADAGRRAEATAMLGLFLDSFRPGDDIPAWLRTYLEDVNLERPIRHEIYERLVFPVLLKGYKASDAWSVLWLAKTGSSLVRCPSLREQIGGKGALQLFKEAYALDPTEEARQLLLVEILRWFLYHQHEWPAGVLYGSHGASVDECDELLQDVALARKLDTGGNKQFIDDFERKVREHSAKQEAK